MSEKSNIEWTDATWNPWRGCTKVSPGCAHCYAEKLVTTRLRGEWGKGAPRMLAKDFDAPLRWNKKPWVCDLTGECFAYQGQQMHRRRVFFSLGDWLDDEVQAEWLARMLVIIYKTPELRYLLLTKRPQKFQARTRAATANANPELQFAWEWIRQRTAPPNVAIGVSVENQKAADERIPQLLATPARWRFLSVEPMLEAIDLHLPAFKALATTQTMGGRERTGEPVTVKYGEQIHWVICGGESGPGARPFNLAWARDLRDQCAAAGVLFFMKQFGSNPHKRGGEDPSETAMCLHDKKGGDLAEGPHDLQIRQVPEF